MLVKVLPEYPLKYTDPDGEFIFTLLAAIFCPPLIPLGIAADIGGAINLGSKALQGKIHSFGDGVAAYGIGAAAGAAGAGIGLGVSSALAGGSFIGGVMGTSTVVSTGFVSGFVSGSAGGFAGGFINGFGNAAMKAGSDFGDMLSGGWNFGWKGALFGGVVGGVTGGIDAVKHNRDFWTGSGKQNVIVNTNGDLIGEQDYNASYASQQTRDNYNTQLSNNRSVSTASDGQLTIKVPSDVNRITGIAAPENTYFTNVNIGRNVLTLTPLDKTSYVILHGWRYYSNPDTSLRDLFYFRPRF